MVVLIIVVVLTGVVLDVEVDVKSTKVDAVYDVVV